VWIKAPPGKVAIDRLGVKQHPIKTACDAKRSKVGMGVDANAGMMLIWTGGGPELLVVVVDGLDGVLACGQRYLPRKPRLG
jgi:hypothetical protein